MAINHRLNKIARDLHESEAFEGTLVNRNIDGMERVTMYPGASLFRGGHRAPRNPFIFLTSKSQATEYAIVRQGPFETYIVREPIRLFVMSPQNMKRYTNRFEDIYSVREVTGYGKPKREIYERSAFSVPGPGELLMKSLRRLKLEVHTHNYLNATDEAEGTYGALRLAKDMRLTLAPLGYDGWIYTHEYVKRADLEIVPSANRIKFHPEILLWNVSKIVRRE